MIEVLTDMLSRLRGDNELALAAISADGMMVAADAAEEIDAEHVCATAGDAYLMMLALGAELQRGEQIMLTVEYEGGTVLIAPLEHGAVLVMMTSGAVNLGRLRLAARRFQSQYLQQAELAA